MTTLYSVSSSTERHIAKGSAPTGRLLLSTAASFEQLPVFPKCWDCRVNNGDQVPAYATFVMIISSLRLHSCFRILHLERKKILPEAPLLSTVFNFSLPT